jgi:hypothetical protein
LARDTSVIKSQLPTKGELKEAKDNTVRNRIRVAFECSMMTNKIKDVLLFDLSNQYKELIHVEPVFTFHKYNWCELIYDEVTYENGFYLNYMSDEGIMSKHMSESKCFHRLSLLTCDKLKTSNSLFAKMCRNINGLL